MTKKNYIVFIFILSLGVFFYMKNTTSNNIVNNKSQSPATSQSNASGTKIIDQNRKQLARIPSSLKYVNRPSPVWKNRLETSLKAQSGTTLKTIKIQKENSFVWMRDKNPLHVESVVVTLTSQEAGESSFRALVDSQTGKVLESWDRTVSDPANVRGGFRIKLDPRYSN